MIQWMTRLSLSLLLLALSQQVLANRIWLDEHWRTTTVEQAKFYLKHPLQPHGKVWQGTLYLKANNHPYYWGHFDSPDMASNHAIGAFKSYQNGRLKFSGTRNHQGLIEGPVTFYGEQGKVASIQQYRNNRPDGVQKIFWPNGQLASIFIVHQGKREGEGKTFRDNGSLKAIYHWENGIKEGETREFYPNGKVHFIDRYHNNERHGISSEYSPKGRLMVQTRYQHGVKDGVEKHWDEHHHLIYLAHYQNGDKEGVAKRFNPQEKVISERQYHNGGRLTDEKLFRNDGSLKAMNEFDSGERMTVHSQYREDGSLQAKTFYRYHPDGLVAEQQIYQDNHLAHVHTRDERSHLIIDEDYNTQGGLIERQSLRQGKREGLQLRVFKGTDHRIHHVEINYHEGLKDGVYSHQSEDGVIDLQGHYHQDDPVGDWLMQTNYSRLTESFDMLGQPIGELKEITISGQLLRLEHYQKGALEGHYERYDTTGRLLALGDYKSGKREGDWLFRKRPYDDSSDIYQGRYHEGVKVGEWKTVADNGQLTSIRYFDDQGRPQGDYYIYSRDGKLTGVRHYEKGRLDGMLVDYRDGKVYRRIIYDHGKAIKTKMTVIPQE